VRVQEARLESEQPAWRAREQLESLDRAHLESLDRAQPEQQERKLGLWGPALWVRLVLSRVRSQVLPPRRMV
jgi:hypothetical protein